MAENKNAVRNASESEGDKKDFQASFSLELVDLKKTYLASREWSKTSEGYRKLFSFLTFFGLYCAILLLQVQPEEVFAMDEALRLGVVDEKGKMQNVQQLGDFFNYLGDQIMPNVFPSEWYNQQPVQTNETGYILAYNKLVGGLLIVQKRGVSTAPCAVPYFTSFPSSYENFYPACFTSRGMEETVPPEKRVLDNATNFPNSVPWMPGVAAPPAGPAPIPDVNATRTNASLGNFWQSFCYDESYGGFASFLAIADGSTINYEKVKALQQYYWLDQYTRSVEIKFAVYNGYYKYFLFVQIEFNYDVTGIWVPYGEDNGVRAHIKAVRPEPYRIGAQYRDSGMVVEADLVLLILELVFLAALSYQIANFLRSLIHVYKREGWAGKEKIDSRTGELINLGGLWGVVRDPFIVLDIVNYALFLFYTVVRMEYVLLLLDPANIITVPTNRYEAILETAAGMVERQFYINFFNVVLMLIRCFKHYRFQPRLAIINKAIGYAFVDLYHFLIMFLTVKRAVLVAYAVMANCMFGAALSKFRTVQESLSTLFVWLLLGAAPTWYAEISYINGTMASLFFVSFMFLIFVVLMNVLLAILVDSYSDAMRDVKHRYHDDPAAIPSLWSNLRESVTRAWMWHSIPEEVLVAIVSHFLRTQRRDVASLDELCRTARRVRWSRQVTPDLLRRHPSIVMYVDPAQAAGAQDKNKKKHVGKGGAEGGEEEEWQGVESLMACINQVVAENETLRRIYSHELAAGRVRQPPAGLIKQPAAKLWREGVVGLRAGSSLTSDASEAATRGGDERQLVAGQVDL